MQSAWITGAKGFIGKHLSRYLQSNGYLVSGIGHGAWTDDAALECGVSYWINGEIDAANLASLYEQTSKPDVIYHLAGGSSVGISYLHPLEDYYRTVSTTARLFDWAATTCPGTVIVCVSSAAVYGAGHHNRIPEETELNPYSPYGYHKAMMEQIGFSYARNFGIKVVVVRLFSVYGVGLEKQLLWDTCVKLKHNSSRLELHGTGHEIRDWLHISDAVRILHMASSAITNEVEIYNGGTGQGVAVRDIARQIIDAWGTNTHLLFSGLARKGDPQSLIANIDKIHSIGFEPHADLAAEVEVFVTAFKQHQGGVK
jgi:UDP-glucose 4-epimerase